MSLFNSFLRSVELFGAVEVAEALREVRSAEDLKRITDAHPAIERKMRQFKEQYQELREATYNDPVVGLETNPLKALEDNLLRELTEKHRIRFAGGTVLTPVQPSEVIHKWSEDLVASPLPEEVPAAATAPDAAEAPLDLTGFEVAPDEAAAPAHAEDETLPELTEAEREEMERLATKIAAE